MPLSLVVDSSLNLDSYYKRNRLTNGWDNIATAVVAIDSTRTCIALT